jgi:hypothetical protein
MAMGLMIAVPKDIQLHSVRDTKTDIMKDGMTHQKTIREVQILY